MNHSPSPEPNPDPGIAAKEQAALNLPCGGSLEDFYSALREAAAARSLVAFPKANPDPAKPAKDV
jgi:hypothetical protein